MSLEFFTPLETDLKEHLSLLHPSSIGGSIRIIDRESTAEDLEGIHIALFGMRASENKAFLPEDNFSLSSIRRELYALFPSQWELKIADLGDILQGEQIEDTEFALKSVLHFLLKRNIIPIFIGGSQDLTYAQYRAYDNLRTMVSFTNIDACFDIGRIDRGVLANSYVGKMIMEEPQNLLNYVNIGYQTYLNPPEEIELIESLFFEAYRLGEITSDITLAEPSFRDADFVSIDLNAISSRTDAHYQPNGFNSREICALARYAGISDKTSSFGLFNPHLLRGKESLIAQIIWHLIEGINYRKNEENEFNSDKFIKFTVPLTEELLVFYKSKKSDRWWMEIPVFLQSRKQENAYIACSYKDYLEACNNQIPERWYKARYRNQL